MDAHMRRLERAVAEVLCALTRHTEPGGPSEGQTINRLLEILNDPDLVGAMISAGAEQRTGGIWATGQSEADRL
jgi:hypothetical protein